MTQGGPPDAVPRSPRPAHPWHELQPPPPERLHGKKWHIGDPHSKYRFSRVLGTGHYGVTYLCACLDSGELAAVKALDKLHPEYERALACEEILVLAAVCDHPNVVELREVWEDSSYIYIVMEACLGGELFDMVIERKYFTEADAASITAAILSVMQHCHSKGIIHRDLKPENFLLLREGDLSAGNLRAIDFGLAKFVDRDAICRSCVGSSYYVAPEVLRGAYSYEADAWSVGTIAYILLSGFPPFWGSSDQIIFHRILNKPVDFEYQPWHQISGAAKDFVGRLLDKDPGRRMTVPQALMHPWITDMAADLPLSTEIISRLQDFTHQNRVKCLLLAVAAHHLSDEEIGGLRKIFHFIDADADGEISVHDLSVALQHAGLELEESGLASLLAGLDLAHVGTVHVEEFIAAALDQRKVLNTQTVNTIFAQLDSDHDGLVTVRELQDALEECNISIKADTLGRLMEREGALDSQGMVSAQSFSDLLMAGQAAEPLELETWMQDVHQFSAANRFKQLAMLVVARHMQPSEVAPLRELFSLLDEDATGAISMAQLQEAMRHMGKEVDEAELRQLLDALDVRHRGVIELDEFLAACLEEGHLTERNLRVAFDYFARNGSDVIRECDVAQVLRDMGLDAGDAGELMAAVTSAGASPRSPASPASPRAISYEDFRRVLLNQPPGIITRALGGAKSLSQPSTRSSGPTSPAGPAGISAAVSGTDVAETAEHCGATAPAACSSREGLFSGQQPQPGLPPVCTRPEPGVSSGEPSPHAGGTMNAGLYSGFQPPSPISLMPRFEPPSPISLMPRHDPLSPGRQLTSPPHRPYAGMGRLSSLGSPIISLAQRHTPPSPLAGVGLGSPGVRIGLGSPDSGGEPASSSGGGGVTLQHILQQYSSSGYGQLRPGSGSKRSSVEAPRGGEAGIFRDSVLSQASDVSESWLGSN